MRYKPERALTPLQYSAQYIVVCEVEMRYKPERALTLDHIVNHSASEIVIGRNEV